MLLVYLQTMEAHLVTWTSQPSSVLSAFFAAWPKQGSRRRFFHPPESQVEVVSVYHQGREFPGLLLQYRRWEEDRGRLWFTGTGPGK